MSRGLVCADGETGKRRYGWKLRLTETGRTLAEQIAREALSIQNRAGCGILPEELVVFYRVLGALNQNFNEISITGGTYEERTDHS